MYQRMLPEDERLRGRATRGRRLWTQRFCKQWKFVRRRIGLRQVELTLAQKRAKAPCLQVFLFGVFVMPLSMYFVTSKLILGYSEDSTAPFFAVSATAVGSVGKLDCASFLSFLVPPKMSTLFSPKKRVVMNYR